jgi:hypothetical protein
MVRKNHIKGFSSQISTIQTYHRQELTDRLELGSGASPEATVEMAWVHGTIVEMAVGEVRITV